MKNGQRAGVFIAGLLLGALLFAISPVVAHHNDTSMKNRISALETKVTKLTKKTKYLSADGVDFGGFVPGHMVWSQSSWGCSNENAEWHTATTGTFVRLSCPGGTYSPSPAAPPRPSP